MRPFGNASRVMEVEVHALEPTLVRVLVMATVFFEGVPDEVMHPDEALKYLEAIAGEIDRIKPRDRSRFALLIHDEAKRQSERAELILSLIPDDPSWAAGE
jgi:hypothetical protein